MGGGLRLRREQVRQRERAALADRALQVVEAHGHEAVSLRALAEELGVSRGAPGRLVAAARRFLGFADAHPQLFRLMYDSGLTQRADAFPALAAAQKGAYDTVFALFCAAAAAQDNASTGGDLRARMIAFWSTIFGYAKIRQAALLQTYMLDDLSAAEVTGAVISTATGFDPLPAT